MPISSEETLWSNLKSSCVYSVVKKFSWSLVTCFPISIKKFFFSPVVANESISPWRTIFHFIIIVKERSKANYLSLFTNSRKALRSISTVKNFRKCFIFFLNKISNSKKYIPMHQECWCTARRFFNISFSSGVHTEITAYYQCKPNQNWNEIEWDLPWLVDICYHSYTD